MQSENKNKLKATNQLMNQKGMNDLLKSLNVQNQKQECYRNKGENKSKDKLLFVLANMFAGCNIATYMQVGSFQVQSNGYFPAGNF